MIEEKKEECQKKRTQTTDKRTNAFNSLENTKDMESKLTKTRLCRSVEKGTPCPHGSRCRFAHSVEELRIKDCVFGDACKFVCKSKSGEYFNRKEFTDRNGNRKKCKACSCRHTGETDRNFFERTGIKAPQPKVRKVELPKFSKAGLEREKARISEENNKKMEQDSKKSNGAGWAHMVKRTSEKTEVKKEHEQVIRVPEKLAQQAIEMAIKMGKPNVRIEIY